MGNYEPANSFDAKQINTAAYAMTELYITPTLRTVFGVRADNTQMYYTGQNNSGTVVYKNKKTLDEFKLLPSLNVVYSLTENMNVRGSFNQTLARPSFREKSIAQIYDPISKRTFNGNINLKQTNVNNMDVRWEHFMKPGEIFAVSGFYKTFENHIENVSFPTSPDDIKPRNAGSSWVYVAEFEIRKSLDFITPILVYFTIGANLSIIKSFVDMNTVYVNDDKTQTEKEAREVVKREGEIIADTRSMAGQSPYLINTYVNYAMDDGLNFNIAYNVQGETLTVVGSSSVPDVYSVAFHSLSFNAFKTFGATSRSKLTIGVNNLLNDTKDQVYKSFEATNQIYASYNSGRLFSLKYSFTF